MLGYHLARYLGSGGVSKLVMEGLWAEEPAVLKTAQAYEELAAKGFLSPTIASSVWPANQNGEMALGEAAMYLNGSWLPNEVREMTGPDFRWGCFAYPAVEGGATGVEAACYASQVYGINKNTEVAEEAFEIITYVTKGEFDLLLSRESLGIPADTTNTEWPDMIACVKPVMDSLSVRYPWAAGVEDNNDMTPIIKENFQRLCGGSITAQEFVDNLAASAK
jgi:raffinose/stachyose/melibiose transport system substrate-binding protein